MSELGTYQGAFTIMRKTLDMLDKSAIIIYIQEQMTAAAVLPFGSIYLLLSQQSFAFLKLIS
jgi:hypothetical protein